MASGGAGDARCEPRRCSVAVIGAGLSGLYAGHLLKDLLGGSEQEVLVLEASADLGGRVKEASGLVPWPIQLGPEFIHGRDNSVLMRLIEGWGWGTRELEWPDKYYFTDSKTACGSEDETREIEEVHEFFENILDIDDADGGANMKELMVRKMGANERHLEIAEVCYANDFGTSLNKMGLAEMKREKAGWIYGESYLLLDRSLSCVVSKLASGVSVLRNWQATRVEYGGGSGRGEGQQKRCRVVRENGDVVECDAVIVTVPLTILKAGEIAFCPPLPSEKLGAISRIGMSTAVKVLLVFKHQFWPDNFWDVCCPFGFLPEIWATKYPSQGGKEAEGGGKVAMVGFVAGDRAEALARLPEDEVVACSLAQLDEMFASPIDRKPASSAFHSCVIKNWSEEPFIRGAYSYPSTARAGDRAALAQPVGSSLFFAGEATHEAVNPCMQGALETAERAVGQVMKSLDVRRRAESKL